LTNKIQQFINNYKKLIKSIWKYEKYVIFI
jgi:hypothetical protein